VTSRKAPVLALTILAAIVLRIFVFFSLDGNLPLEGLYVDENTYVGSPFVRGIQGFSRPPGMFVALFLTGSGDSVIPSRIAMSLISLLPALALYLALGRNGGRQALIAAGLAFSPFLVLFGFQLVPAVPAAVLLSFALLAAQRGRTALAGVLAGAAALFRAELALVPLILLAVSFRHHLKRWLVFTSMFACSAVPVILVNAISGAGPVISANGGENLLIGSGWDMIATPPGVEFEELVSTGNGAGTGDAILFREALKRIGEDPAGWTGRGAVKALAFFSLPGPGRNMETGWLLGRTRLVFLLPLTLLAMSMGLTAALTGRKEFWQLLAVSVIAAGLISSFIFFPSARFRTAVIPAFWFLAAGAARLPGVLRRSLIPAAAIILVSVILRYPGMERRGLTSLLVAEHHLGRGDLNSCLEHLESAEARGYRGADVHNVRGACLSLSGFMEEGLGEFGEALVIAPRSPTLWKNYAVSLWSNRMYRESLDAARRAIYLNPLLRAELSPILEYGEDHR
jgi:hypothetical protein